MQTDKLSFYGLHIGLHIRRPGRATPKHKHKKQKHKHKKKKNINTNFPNK